LFAPWLAPYDYKDQDILARLQGPSAAHWFGTDDLGRDILSRIIWGSRVSITVSFGAVSLGVGLGTLIGLCAGYFRGAFDLVSQRLVDFIMSMPALIILLVIVSVAGRGLPTLIVALGVVQSALSTRLARATTLQLSGRQFVDAARVLGCSGPRILFRHILPG